MGDLTNRKLIIAKGFLFLLLGVLASVLLLIRAPEVTVAVLHFAAIWAFCRFYYFAFYVIEHYVDSEFRFAGLTSFVCYIARSKQAAVSQDDGD